MAKVMISVMQNCIFTSSSALPRPSRKANLLAPPRKPPPLFAVQSSLLQEAANPIKKEDEAAEQTAEFFNLFRDYGFEDPQIEKLRKCRYVAKLNAKIIKFKLDFFVENGFTGELLHNLLVSNPYILVRSLDLCIKPRFQFLKQYLDSDEKVITLIDGLKWEIFEGNFKLKFVPNIEFLINEGVPVNHVSQLLLLQPRVLLQSRDRISYAVKSVRESGVALDDPMFIDSLREAWRLSDLKLRKKMEVLKSFGWNDEQIMHLVKKRPSCLRITEEKLRSRIGFLLDTIKLEPEFVISHPILLTYAEERILARYEVLKILRSKKLIRYKVVKISTAVTYSDDLFLKSFVLKHVESVPGILDMYNAIAHKGKNRKGKKTET